MFHRDINRNEQLFLLKNIYLFKKKDREEMELRVIWMNNGRVLSYVHI